jgi:AraC-like DNA-binding protein
MRQTTQLFAAEGVSIEEIRVQERQPRWCPPEMHGQHRLIMVRRGSFRLRIRGWETVADPLVAYFARPGDEQRIAHQVGRQDMCTAVTMADSVLAELVGDQLASPDLPLLTTGRIDLAHRMLTVRARDRRTDQFELVERALLLLGEALRAARSTRRTGRPRAAASRHRLAWSAREALVADPAIGGLSVLAARLGVSAPHLSRVFREETGETLTRFRTRVRIGLFLERIEAGERDLAALAAELGFADHAHLTRTVREELGCPPTHVRKLLAMPPAPAA